MDRIKFMLEQVIEAMPEENRPAGIKALDKIDAYRKETYEKSGGREVPTHKDAFDAIMEQARAEEGAQAQTEATTRTDERKRTLREVMTRRSASNATGPGNARTVPRAARPGRRTFDQLEKAGEISSSRKDKESRMDIAKQPWYTRWGIWCQLTLAWVASLLVGAPVAFGMADEVTTTVLTNDEATEYIAEKTLRVALVHLAAYQFAEKHTLAANSGRLFQMTRYEHLTLPRTP